MSFVDRVARLLGIEAAGSLRGLGIPPGHRALVPSLLHTAPGGDDRARATALARRIAAGTGIALDGIDGSGPGGRITRADILRIAAPPVAPLPAPAPAPAPVGKNAVPHFYLSADCGVDAALMLCARFDAGLGLADVVVKAVALALRKVPEINAEWGDDAIRRRRSIDVAFAATVVADADRIGLVDIAAARVSPLSADRPAGFTIADGGGAQTFTPVIAPPQAAALGLGAAEQRAVVRDGVLVVATMATLTLAADHRVVDGATGARFLATVKDLLENPVTLLL